MTLSRPSATSRPSRAGAERADVALVTPYPGDRSALPSGVAHYSEQLAKALVGEGLDVHVLAPAMPGEPARRRSGGVTVERPFRRGTGALPSAAAAALRTGAPVVHVQFETFLYGGPPSVAGVVPALAALRRRDRGPVVTLHQVVDPATVDREFTQIHRVRVPAVAARLGLAGLQRAVGTLSAATVVLEPSFRQVVPGAVSVPHGLDAGRPAPTPPDPERRRQRKHDLGLHQDRLTAMCFGFLAPYKGLETAIEAAALAGEVVELVVAGGSHPRLAGRDPYAEDLRRQYGHVARFVGYVPDDRVAEWFDAADVLMLPYPRPFASSGPLAQALGFGTPVLCSPALARCVGAPDELVAPLDPAGLGAHLRALANDRSRLRSLGTAGQALAAGRSWEAVARRHVDLYEEVISAHRTPGRRLRPRQPR